MGLTVKGSPMNGTQQTTAETLLGVAGKLNAGSLAAEACIFDAIFESDLGADTTWNPTYGGVLGGAQSTFGSLGSSSSNAVTVAEATSFFKGGNGYQGGGAIALARTHDDVAYIGSQVTAAVPFDSNGYSTQYQSQGFAFSDAVAEAKAIVAAYGGNNLKGAIAGGSSGGTGTILDSSALTTYAFSIGGTSNPDEDFWTGCNRLAQEVNWYFFTNGEYLYYLDGQEMIAQRPALYLDRISDSARIVSLNLTYDNTAYAFVAHRKRKFTTQRPATVAISTSPTSANLELICGIDEIRGGDVIVLTSCGIGDGRWIVGECRRSVFATSSQITLVPAVAPITEATAAGTTGKKGSTPTNTPVKGTQGSLSQVVSLATRAAALQEQQRCYTYNASTVSAGSGEVRTNSGNGVLSPPYVFDCSGFAEACYRFAGLGDPAGNTGYLGSSFAISGSSACVQVNANDAVPGDLVVFPDHVVVYIGKGNCVSMGGKGDPIITTVAAEAAYKNRGIVGYYHLRGAS